MESTASNNADLIAATLAGDREAFGKLYDKHSRIVRAVVGSVSGDWNFAEDMVQETFLRAYRKLSTIRQPDHFGRWVVGIARQVGRERRRTLKRDRHQFIGLAPTEKESVRDETAEIEYRDQFHVVMKRLAKMPEKQRLAVHAMFLNGQNARQVAESLGLSRSGFYALVRRAIAQLAIPISSHDSQQKGKRL